VRVVAKTRCTYAFRPADTDGARLLKVLGARRLAALQAAFGGKRVWVPKSGANMRCVVCSLRDRCIRAWRRRGLPVENIARSLGVSAQTVYRVLRSSGASMRIRPTAGAAPR
jgi:hypothetical protein